MKPDVNASSPKFIRRVDPSVYIENQTVNIGSGGGSDTVENLLIGDELLAYEFEIEGQRIVLLGFETKN